MRTFVIIFEIRVLYNWLRYYINISNFHLHRRSVLLLLILLWENLLHNCISCCPRRKYSMIINWFHICRPKGVGRLLYLSLFVELTSISPRSSIHSSCRLKRYSLILSIGWMHILRIVKTTSCKHTILIVLHREYVISQMHLFMMRRIKIFQVYSKALHFIVHS